MIKFVYQNKPDGTGSAVLKCKKYLKDKYFLMLLADDLIVKKNCSIEMISLSSEETDPLLACMASSRIRINTSDAERSALSSVEYRMSR